MSGRRVLVGLVGVVLGVLGVSGALLAVLHDRDREDDPEPEPDGTEEEQSGVEAEAELSHTFPAEYDGPVWVTVDAADGGTRTVTISWGPWQRVISHAEEEPVTYVFDKNPTAAGDETVPTSVRVEPAAEVEFGSGTEVPEGAQDVNQDWIPSAED